MPVVVKKGFWEICWLSSGHRNPYQQANMRLLLSCEGCSTNGEYDLFHFSPLFWKIQVWPKQDLDDGTLPMDDFDEDSAGSWDKGSFDVHQLNYLHCNKFIKIAFLDMWL